MVVVVVSNRNTSLNFQPVLKGDLIENQVYQLKASHLLSVRNLGPVLISAFVMTLIVFRDLQFGCVENVLLQKRISDDYGVFPQHLLEI